VNEKKIDEIVGTHTSMTCRNVGIPTMSQKTTRSWPENCNDESSRRRLDFLVVGGLVVAIDDS
jgi:hypothetical protein